MTWHLSNYRYPFSITKSLENSAPTGRKHSIRHGLSTTAGSQLWKCWRPFSGVNVAYSYVCLASAFRLLHAPLVSSRKRDRMNAQNPTCTREKRKGIQCSRLYCTVQMCSARYLLNIRVMLRVHSTCHIRTAHEAIKSVSKEQCRVGRTQNWQHILSRKQQISEQISEQWWWLLRTGISSHAQIWKSYHYCRSRRRRAKD